MPCYDPRDRPAYTGDELQALKNEICRLSERNTKLTQLLCKADKVISNGGVVPTSLSRWFKEHRAVDKKRRRVR